MSRVCVSAIIRCRRDTEIRCANFPMFLLYHTFQKKAIHKYENSEKHRKNAENRLLRSGFQNDYANSLSNAERRRQTESPSMATLSSSREG